jgi:uncharacterized protein with GYD domain
MSTYDDASLILYPSGYKEDKIYSLKPTDGSGDLTFTRASSATRVNSDGLIETPSVLGSELVTNGDFATDTSWTKGTGVTISGGKANWTNTINNVGVTQSGIITSGKNYKVVFTVSNYSSGSVRLRFPLITERLTSNGTYTYYINATDTDLYIQGETNGDANVNLSIDNVSVKEVITSNIPRIDYTGGGCGKLLLEPQRTNLVTYSEQFDNAAWVKVTNPTITANATTSPDGTTNADKLIPSTSVGRQAVSQNNSSTGAVSMSVYAKKGEYDIVQLTDSRNPTAFANFDLTNGVLGSVSDFTATIVSVGSGWYRCSISYNYTLSVSAFRISVQQLATSVRLPEWAGNGTDGIYIYGAQLEQGSYPTSYIPTTTTAVTRVADAASKTGISSLIGDSEGWIYGEVQGITDTYGSTSTILSVSDGTTNNRVQFSFNSAQNIVTPRIFVGGSTIFVGDISLTITNKFKFAVQYSGTTAVCYINGTQVASTSGLTFFADGTLNRVAFDQGNGSVLGIGNVSQVIIGQTALTNTQLAELTTL